MTPRVTEEGREDHQFRGLLPQWGGLLLGTESQMRIKVKRQWLLVSVYTFDREVVAVGLFTVSFVGES